MHERIARQVRQLVLERRYVVALHAYDEMAPDSLSLWDVESALLNGEVLELQRDRLRIGDVRTHHLGRKQIMDGILCQSDGGMKSPRQDTRA